MTGRKQSAGVITVHKLSPTGEELIQYAGILLERSSSGVKIEALFGLDDIDLHGLEINKGDRFIEWYFNDRWYNVFAIYDSDTRGLKGWYCNITRPARIESKHIYAEDLALDLVVFPQGDWIVLDRDEFETLDLPEQDQQAAERAILDLINEAATFKHRFVEGAPLS